MNYKFNIGQLVRIKPDAYSAKSLLWFNGRKGRVINRRNSDDKFPHFFAEGNCYQVKIEGAKPWINEISLERIA